MTPVLPDHFEVLATLGQGTFGVVYEVRDTRSGERRALKCVQVTGDGRREAREAEAFQKLDHPHVLGCYETGTSPGQLWILTEVADGSLLDAFREPGRARETLGLLAQAARGVGALHAAGMTHRDLKPENILLVGENAKVADLGLVRGEDMETLTATGVIFGTPQYMAPEQARGEKAGPAADVYALGAMAYELVEGSRLHPAGTAIGELLIRVGTGVTVRFRRAKKRWSPELLELIRSALDPDPVRRPENLEVWARELERQRRKPAASPAKPAAAMDTLVLSTGVPVLPPSGRASPVPTPKVRRKAPPTDQTKSPLWIAGAVALCVAGLWYSKDSTPPPSSPSPPPPPPPSIPTGPFPNEWLQDLREELEAAKSRRLKGPNPDRPRPATGRNPEEPALPEPFLHFGIRAWGQTLLALPEVTRFHEWRLRGGEPETLSPDLLRALAQIDEAYAEAGTFRPFSPYLDLHRSPPGPTETQTASRWLDAASRELAALDRLANTSLTDVRLYLSGNRRSNFPGSALSIHEFREAIQQAADEGDVPSLFRAIRQMAFRSGDARYELVRWALPLFDQAERVLACLDRADRAREPGLAAALVSLLQSPVFGTLSWGRWTSLPERMIPGAVTGTPEGLFLATWQQYLLFSRELRYGSYLAKRGPEFVDAWRAVRQSLSPTSPQETDAHRFLLGYASFYEGNFLVRGVKGMPKATLFSRLSELSKVLPHLAPDARLSVAFHLATILIRHLDHEPGTETTATIKTLREGLAGKEMTERMLGINLTYRVAHKRLKTLESRFSAYGSAATSGH